MLGKTGLERGTLSAEVVNGNFEKIHAVWVLTKFKFKEVHLS